LRNVHVSYMTSEIVSLIPRLHIHGIRPQKSHGLIPASSVATRTGQ
jgi:hypothetical protein